MCNRNTFLLYNKYPDMSIVYHTGIPSIYKIFYYDFLLSVLLDQLPEFLIALKEVVF